MSKGKVLVVDDNPTQLSFMRAPFEENGYEVLTATDGEAALHVALQEDLLLVVLDVVMPKMNGFQACKKIKDQKATLPVILLTSKDQKSDEFWGKRQGADLYMTKPFDGQELYANALKLIS